MTLERPVGQLTGLSFGLVQVCASFADEVFRPLLE
jgi:hypothetical protein